VQAKTVLFTWEIGQGFGHVMPLLPVARELKAQGHRVTFALRDVRAAGALLKAEGFTVLQAPTHPDQFFPANGPQPQTMADILEIFGFASGKNLSGMVAAWEGLFSVCRPDVVVASYAPLSLLCARHAGIPTVLMALPFELPSPAHPSLVIRTGKTPNSSATDDRVISTVNKVFGLQAVNTIYEIFKADKTFIMSFPELDFLYPRQQVEYCGSFFVTDVGASPQWPSREGKRIFAYLNTGLHDLDSLRNQIQASQHSYCIFLRGADASLIAKWLAPNVYVSGDVVMLDEALAGCDAVLSYGGNGFVSASLLAGKPLVFYVRDLEAYLTARQVAKMGAGLLPQPQTAFGVLSGLDQVLNESSYKNAGENFAQLQLARHAPKAAKVVAGAILKTVLVRPATI
jgi:UDP:flavonoid glycosyltransferase YjiC (YdhE family)